MSCPIYVRDLYNFPSLYDTQTSDEKDVMGSYGQ